MSLHVPTPAEIVMAAFPGKGFVPFRQASEFIGLAYQTGRHHLAAGTFPLPTVIFGTRKRLVPITALVDYYARQIEQAGLMQPAPRPTAQPDGQAKRRPGRPKKMDPGGAV